LMDAVPSRYIEKLSHPTLSLSRVTTLQMLTHLWTTYGQINHVDLLENDERMTAPWNPDDGIDALFTQIKQAREFATAGNSPITDIQAMSRAYQNIENTGVFTDACREWRLTPTLLQTWPAFEEKFRLADTDNARTRTSRSAGYHHANAAAAPVSIAPTPTPRPAPRTPTGPRPITSYCWTHGLLRASNHVHDSKNCRNKVEGHQDAATITNQMGGETKEYKPRRINRE
jgi:hypothetical protein